MIIAVDFDNTLVEGDHLYADTFTPYKLKQGALAALRRLKAAGHTLVLWSSRNNRSRQTLPELDPLVRAGVRSGRLTDEGRAIEAARWRHMLDYVRAELPGIFDAVDDGRDGKIAADLYVDSKACPVGRADGLTWEELASVYG